MHAREGAFRAGMRAKRVSFFLFCMMCRYTLSLFPPSPSTTGRKTHARAHARRGTHTGWTQGHRDDGSRGSTHLMTVVARRARVELCKVKLFLGSGTHNIANGQKQHESEDGGKSGLGTRELVPSAGPLHELIFSQLLPNLFSQDSHRRTSARADTPSYLRLETPVEEREGPRRKSARGCAREREHRRRQRGAGRDGDGRTGVDRGGWLIFFLSLFLVDVCCGCAHHRVATLLS